VLPLAALLIVLILAFVAYSVDLGYISITRAKLQTASDAAALGAACRLLDGLGPAPLPASMVQANAQATAVAVAAANTAGDQMSVALDAGTDITLGRRVYNPSTSSWQYLWGTTPYNAVRITAVRGRGAVGQPDGPLSLFFAPVIGHDQANVSGTAKAALQAISGFRLKQGATSNCELLPIAYDKPSWDQLMAGVGSDNYSYNPSTGAVASGADGVKEIDLYPYGNQALTPGNRGTVDIGSPNNSTADLSRQIRYGVNAADLAYFGGSIDLNGGPLNLNGDTGISAGIKDDLQSIIGKPRVIPIFESVTGPGNNAVFRIVKWAGIRIMYVKLTGGDKKVIAQPAPIMSSWAIPATTETLSDYVFTKPRLVD